MHASRHRWQPARDARVAAPPPHRPPWWPDDAPFPPERREAWRDVRRHLLRRVALVVGGALGLIVVIAALTTVVVSEAAVGTAGRVTVVAVVVLVLVVALLFAAVRRTAVALAEVVTVADRVASGDHGARVRPRGPREVRRLGLSINAIAQRLEEERVHRRDLLADLAHELRPPVATVRANVERLSGGHELDETTLRALLHEAESMSWLLDDLRTLSAADAGALQLHREWVDVGALVLDVTGRYQAQADSARITLTAHVPPDLDALDCDGVRIEDALSDLISNALRHTPDGGVVTVTARADGAAAEVAVAHSGEGIEPDELPRVFDRYVRASDAAGGTGLGLAIAQRVVEAHGGTVTVETHPGEGSTFRITLPIQERE